MKIHSDSCNGNSGSDVFVGMFACIIGLCVLFSMFGGSEKKQRTDGVFESATKKIDTGRADELTPQEAQRIDDIVNWCNICKKPLRSCKHGK